MTNASWNLDKNQYNQIVSELKSGATVSVNIGSLSVPMLVEVNAVVFDGYAYMLTESDVLYRYEEKFDFPDIVATRECNKPENVAKRLAEQAEQDREADEWRQMTEWFLAHPSA